ncbi:MAG: DUF1015 domain-containing protein [Elusimicrobia bacterium]|jgi:uncharacterized protein (DUF1015 family)|nr:DUF1015 domain-containing protein [Elusimicrobiota bacterium]
MPDIKPFRAFVYGAKYQKKIGRLVCPPYDVISPPGRESLVKKDPQNFVRVELPMGDPSARYDEAAKQWKKWNAEGVLTREKTPVFYVYEARFRSPVDGRPLVRRGFFAALKVVPWGQGVYPHEKTLPTAKVDRLLLFKALRAQTSPIQLLVRDASGRVEALTRLQTKGHPWMQFKDESGVTHRLWIWKNDAAARELQRVFKKSPCAIADGHHRYETSLAYSQWARRSLKNGAPAADHVLAYFSSSDDKGLEVLPTHRAVPWEKRKFVNLEKWGNLKPVRGLNALKKLIDGKKGPGVLEVGVYRDGKYFLYTFSQIPGELKNTPHENLAVACLHGGPLKGLGKEDFFFTRNPTEAVKSAQHSKGWAFFLAPNTVKEVLDVSTLGSVMPPKSTYFYPKIPSGMVSHALQGKL